MEIFTENTELLRVAKRSEKTGGTDRNVCPT